MKGESMQIDIVPAGLLQANSYLLTKDNKNAVLIDCGGAEVLKFAESKGLKIGAVLLTHGHFDHIGGCAEAQEAGAKIGCSKEDAKILSSNENLSGMTGVPMKKFNADFTFQDGDTLSFFGMDFKVISTPGHTRGSVSFLFEDCLFTGDTLFYGSAGRTDFPGGDENELFSSLKKLSLIEGDLKVYPGHDKATSLDRERKYNPYVRLAMSREE